MTEETTIPFDPDLRTPPAIIPETSQSILASRSLFPSESKVIPLSLIVEFPINKDIWGDKSKEDTDNSLSSQIQETGFCAPLLVIPTDHRYMLVSGHRRRQALLLQGVKEARCDVYNTPNISLYREWLLHPPEDLAAEDINRQRKLAYQDIAALILACNTSRFTSFHPALIKAASACVKKYDMDSARVLKIIASTNQACADLLGRCLKALEGVDQSNYARTLKSLETAATNGRLEESLKRAAEISNGKKTASKSSTEHCQSPDKADAQGPLRGDPEEKTASPAVNIEEGIAAKEHRERKDETARQSARKLLGSISRSIQSLNPPDSVTSAINTIAQWLEP